MAGSAAVPSSSEEVKQGSHTGAVQSQSPNLILFLAQPERIGLAGSAVVKQGAHAGPAKSQGPKFASLFGAA